jgi:soluble lytic murein transglycosylase-like protein
MDLFSEIAAVQNRIASIVGLEPDEQQAPVADAQPGRFAKLVTQAMDGGTGTGGFAPGSFMPDGLQAMRAPAPVAPAQIDALVQQNAAVWQVDPALVKAVIANESGFNANASSPVGAQGLMQLMPDTAASLGVRDAYDPAQNVAGGTRYLKQMLDRFGGDVTRAVAAYNAGPEAVEKYNGVPPYAETQGYVTNVLGSYDRYRTR